mgnify:CR=1 FL=1
MKDLMIFKNEEFGKIRTLQINNEPWFVAKDISDKLGYAETSNMIKRIDKEDFISSKLEGMNMKSIIINESGLYSAIIGSKLESAKRFKHWVTSEVLPSIRKTGGYIAGEENMNEDELVLKAMNVLNRKVENLRQENNQLKLENEKQDQLIGELKPKADYTDRILKCDDLTKVNIIACDYGFTATEFNKLLKSLGIQYREGKDWLLYKNYRGKGYTQTKTFEYTHKNGTKGSRTTMYWTQKGRLFLYEFLKQRDILPRMEE